MSASNWQGCPVDAAKCIAVLPVRDVRMRIVARMSSQDNMPKMSRIILQ